MPERAFAYNPTSPQPSSNIAIISIKCINLLVETNKPHLCLVHERLNSQLISKLNVDMQYCFNVSTCLGAEVELVILTVDWKSRRA